MGLIWVNGGLGVWVSEFNLSLPRPLQGHALHLHTGGAPVAGQLLARPTSVVIVIPTIVPLSLAHDVPTNPILGIKVPASKSRKPFRTRISRLRRSLTPTRSSKAQSLHLEALCYIPKTLNLSTVSLKTGRPEPSRGRSSKSHSIEL